MFVKVCQTSEKALSEPVKNPGKSVKVCQTPRESCQSLSRILESLSKSARRREGLVRACQESWKVFQSLPEAEKVLSEPVRNPGKSVGLSGMSIRLPEGLSGSPGIPR